MYFKLWGASYHCGLSSCKSLLVAFLKSNINKHTQSFKVHVHPLCLQSMKLIVFNKFWQQVGPSRYEPKKYEWKRIHQFWVIWSFLTWVHVYYFLESKGLWLMSHELYTWWRWRHCAAMRIDLPSSGACAVPALFMVLWICDRSLCSIIAKWQECRIVLN